MTFAGTNLCRTRLRAVMNECAEMLDTLGVAWVQAVGEAESAAAKLNAEEKVDAVITDDSDAFCYGAVTVLRNFTISGKLEESIPGLEKAKNLSFPIRPFQKDNFLHRFSKARL